MYIYICGLLYSLTQHIFIELSRAEDTEVTKTNSPCPQRAPSGSCRLHRPFHTFPQSVMAHGPLYIYTQTLTNVHDDSQIQTNIYESHREICGCMHTRAHTEVRRVQSPRVVPESARGSLLAAPTCPHPKPWSQGSALPPGGPPASDAGLQAEGMHMRMCVCMLRALEGRTRPGP